MRIRKRPPPSPEILPADPFPRPKASNGREESMEERARGGERGGLHLHGDLPTNLQGWWRWRDPALTQVLKDPPPFDPHPTTEIASPPASHLNGYCIPSSHATGVQVLQEEDEKEEVEGDLHKTWIAVVNSNKRNGSSSNGKVSGETVIVGAATEGRGWDGPNAFPLKKRKGVYEIGDEKPMAKSKARAKASTALKGNTSIGIISSSNHKSSDDVVVNEQLGGGLDGNVEGKKRRSPAVLMEGSRCSRVNGRGWRCSQQTLVGYSLCEHHLGKGRLRSMSSVRGQPVGDKPNKAATGRDASMVLSLLPQEQQEKQQYMGVLNVEEEEEEKPAKKSRKKLGMVKARSISSLIKESNHSMAVVRANEDACS